MKRGLSPVLLITVIGLVAGALLLWFFVQTNQGTGSETNGPSAHSRSAIGYAGIVDVLRQLGMRVEAEADNEVAAKGGGLLVVAEPDDSAIYSSDAGLRRLVQAPKVLIVLPKWYGSRNGLVGWEWIDAAYPRSVSDATRVMNLVTNSGQVHRVDKVAKWQLNVLGRTPIFKHDVQLIKGSALLPLIFSNEGVLLGEIRRPGQTIWILSDPDVIANHGLGERGEGNAILAVEMFKRLQGSEGKIVFAEGIHGLRAKPERPALAMFQFPFYIVTAMAAMAIILLLWATAGRFGAPLKAPPPLASGKEGLVDNVARLMEYAGHHKLMIVRYVEGTILDAGRQLHAPKGLVGAELAAWLTKLGRARGTTLECSQIFNRANKLIKDKRSTRAAFVTIAQDAYRWKQEIIDGPSKHTRNN